MTGYPTHDLEPADEMLKLIRQMVRRISEHSKYLSREVGLTVPQLLCLKAVGELESQGADITVAMVGEQVQLSPATVSRVIDRLVRASLVVRERQEKDRRKVCLTLTAAGLERYGTLPTPLQEKFVEELMALPEGERANLLEAMRTVARLMNATELDAAPVLTPGAIVPSES